MTPWTFITYVAVLIAAVFLVSLLLLPIIGIISFVIDKLSD